MALEYLVYCDESVSKGPYFSNFYGGALVRSTDHQEIRAALIAKRQELNLTGEVKWQKITEAYAQKYIELMDLFFDYVAADRVKIRIMFTQNMFAPRRLTAEQVDDEYFILYYQFLKHAFGFMHINEPQKAKLRLYLDQLADSQETISKFRGFLLGLNSNKQFSNAGLQLDAEDIADVDSKQHDILQCLDVVLGSMQFKLNNKHREIPEGKKRRGKRTRAKERVYKFISARIRQIYPNFNIGCSTGSAEGLHMRWVHPYRHWLLVPSDMKIAGTSKNKKK